MINKKLTISILCAMVLLSLSSFAQTPAPDIVATVTTQAVSDITGTTATGNGNITDLGIPNPTAYGVCWSTSASPTTSNDTTNLGDASATGAYTTNMTGLAPNTTYNVRAYATNTEGTAYGNELSFSTPGMILNYSIDSPNTDIELPLYGNVDVTVDWGDGSLAEAITTEGKHAHTFTSAGDYVVTISGTLTQFGKTNELSAGISKLVSVDSWDGLGLTSLEYAFWGATNLTTVPNALPTTSTVNVLFGTFNGATSFDQDIDGWDVSAVVNMGEMFYGASSFDRDLNSWNVGNVILMPYMFYNAAAFDGNISSWNVIKVTTMNNMFHGATDFNQDISGWDVDEVTTTASMFNSATAFNQNISGWDVSKVENMGAMFRLASNFDQDLSTWDVSAVTDMTNMFLNVTLSTANYDAMLTAWAALTTPTVRNNVVFNAGNSVYSSAASGSRSTLTGTYGWTISDGGIQTAATISTQEATNVASYSATLNGTFTDLGVPNPTAHGFCWNISETPTIDDFKNDLGPKSGTGTFTSNISSLDTMTTYYVRAYATNGGVTTYGNEISFTTAGMKLHYSITLPGIEIELPLYGSVDVAVNWGDGSSTELITSTGNLSHTYTSAGEYDVIISGSLTQFGSNSTTGINKLVSVDAWEGLGLTSLQYAFWGASSLTTVPNALPTTSTVTNLYGAFGGATSFNHDISDWNVSNVNNMGDMFNGASIFNIDISGWNVGNVTLMPYMFYNASAFNRNIGTWDVSNVTTMNNMFHGATAFNQDISGWDVRLVTTMANMFTDVTLSTANYDAMLTAWAALTGPTVQNDVVFSAGNSVYSSNATDDRSTLTETYNWTITDGGLETAATITTQAVSAITATTATGNGNITLLGIPNPIQHGVCWSKESNPTIDDINDFKTEEGPVLATGAFTSAITNLDLISTYYVRAYVTNAAGTTYGNEVSFTTTGMKLHYSIDSPNTDIELPLYGNVNVSVNWGDGNSESFTTAGKHAHTFTSTGDYDVIISGTLTQFGKINVLSAGISKLVSVDSWDGLGLTSLEYAFWGATSLTAVPNALPTTSTVNVLFGTFNGATSFDQNINGWDVSAVVNMGEMFYGASSFNQDLNGWEVGNVILMPYMFYNASAFDGNIVDWDVSKVTTMNNMFHGATAFKQNIGSWTVGEVTTMASMFNSATAFNQNIGSWDVSKVENTSAMFRLAPNFDQDLSGWNLAADTTMVSMFNGASSFDQDISTWDVSAVTDMTNMFLNVTLSTANYDAMLTAWAALTVQNNVVFNAGNSVYSSAASGSRSTLTGTYGWTITDGGMGTTSTVSTQEATNVASYSATLNGTFTDLGIPNPTAHGFCWNISGTPTLADDNNDLGSRTITGNFSDNITDLDTMTTYYVRAYATNASGTVYGNEISFTTAAIKLHYFNNLPNTEIELPLYGTVNVAVNWGDGSTTEFITTSGKHSHTYTSDGEYDVIISGSLTQFGSTSVTGIDKLVRVDAWHGLGLTSLANAFWGATSLTTVPDSIPGTITSLYGLFTGATAFNQNISGWDVSAVVNMGNMFYAASIFNQNISSWDVANVIKMDYMFYQAYAFNQPIGTWIVSNVDAMNNMFHAATAFDQDISGWDVRKVTTMANMFTDLTLSTSNYDAMLTAWAALTGTTVQNDVVFNAGNSKYTTGTASIARQSLIDDRNWTITDGGAEAIPDNETVSDITIANGQSVCYNAHVTITVAGESVVEIESGADAVFIAEQNIRFLPGFHAFSGSYVDAHITETGSFCDDLPSSIVAAEPIAEKSTVVVQESIEEKVQTEQQLMKVYPNPNTGRFTIQLSNFTNEVKLSVYNSLGAQVHQVKTFNESTTIDLSNFKRGIYFVRASDNEVLLTQKLIIQ